MSKIPPENNASFLETMAKGILNWSQGTTFLAKRTKTLWSVCPQNQWNSTTSGEGWVGALCPLRTAKGNLISRPIETLCPLEEVPEDDNLHDSKIRNLRTLKK